MIAPDMDAGHFPQFAYPLEPTRDDDEVVDSDARGRPVDMAVFTPVDPAKTMTGAILGFARCFQVYVGDA